MSRTVVNIHDLRFAWPGHDPVLEIPALQIAQGERVFIKGPSGSGKSTLLGLLAGIQTVNHGTLEVLGQPLAQLSSRDRDGFRAGQLGYIFQQFNLLPYLSVIDNVTSALTFSPQKRARLNAAPEAEARRLLGELQLPEAALSRPVHALSIGQQQRVAAARALIGAPPLVIADEPTSALDTDNRAAFIRLLFKECDQQGSTLIFVSHDPFLEPLFPRVENLQQLNRRSQC
ncbi:ABC transporter ATP-binding protein [Aeromonas simiae]|uniref:ABC transporter ATP-binding protein n=1 Tax=Aeromonas simiae TaxID=218936 RepID=UPI00266CC399|nr:ABC transporter ATP-binding protein [Aeromonas simiae]MDO2949714.1 ABC transporter ATP-binding protein [Aeromonas simiae]MDO2953387.1 ABC transporter ATP-binding protein [Aeromonas simiae]MDO2957045.1 ABC transporter ATP-binding protein [Aeromonas simiae]